MANEKRLIDANALKDDTFILNSWDAPIVRAWLDDQPTVEAVEVVHGRWEYNGEIDHDGNLQAYCSCCGSGDKHAPCMVGNVPFCWKCGAKMDLPSVTAQTIDALNRMGEKAHGGNDDGCRY